MKQLSIITFIAISLIASVPTFGQYAFIDHSNLQHKNPGGLNTCWEYWNWSASGLDSGWTQIVWPTGNLTLDWTQSNVIPFPFEFNGQPVTHFKVSKTGVLTFDTSAVFVPPSITSSLPSSNIPDKSICVWGFGTSYFYSLQVKEFGSAPHRQFWIYLKNFRINGNSTNFSWYIVLEETTNKIFLVQPTYSYHATFPLRLGVQIDSTNAVQIPSPQMPFSFIQSPLDNYIYEFVPGILPGNDVELMSIEAPEYLLNGTPHPLTYNILNKGTNTITELTLKYNLNGNTYSDLKTGLSIPSGGIIQMDHTDLLNVNINAPNTIDAWIEMTNDADVQNNSSQKIINGMSFPTTKKIVIESTSGTWCSSNECGFMYLDSMAFQFPGNVECINIHQSPALTEISYVQGLYEWFPGVPIGFMDRKYNGLFGSEYYFAYPLRIAETAPCDITVATTFDPVSRNLSATVTAHFATELSGEYRFNAVIVQENFDNDTVYHDRSGLVILGGFNGEPGSLPATITDGGIYQHTFIFTLPLNWDESLIRVVGWVSDFSTNYIINANGENITTGVNEPNLSGLGVYVLGNPVTSTSKLKLVNADNQFAKIELTNSSGQIIRTLFEGKFSAGEHYFDLAQKSLSPGIYLIRIQYGDEVLCKRFVVLE